MLGVKVSGRGVTAYTDRPGFRGDLLLCDSRSVSAGTRTAYEAGLNLHCGAQNRVLCVAYPALRGYVGIGERRVSRRGRGDWRYCPLKPCLQKRIEPVRNAVENT